MRDGGFVVGRVQSGSRVSSGRPIEEEYAYSRAVRMDDRVFVSGTTALNADGGEGKVSTVNAIGGLHWL